MLHPLFFGEKRLARLSHAQQIHRKKKCCFSLSIDHKSTSVKLAADSTFFSEHSHINLCLSNLSVCLIELDELYPVMQSDFP